MAVEILTTLDYPRSELVIGLVYAVGTDDRIIEQTLGDHLRQFGGESPAECYTPNIIRLSAYLPRFNLGIPLPDTPEFERISSRMNAGNKLCELAERGDVLTLVAVSEISKSRGLSDGPKRTSRPKTVHVLLSLKRPEEVVALRRIYGPGFFLIGVFASEKDRLQYLTRDKNIPRNKAQELIQRDEHEEEVPMGQRTRNTFQLADAFLKLKADELEKFKDQLSRFVNLAFGKPVETPTPEENAMFLAYAASLRSADLSRQVGAAVVTKTGEVVGLGCNDVPREGGGLYWPGPDDQRDYVREFDSNERRKDEIIQDVMRRLQPQLPEGDRISQGRTLLAGSPLMDITEYGRSVHAEMEALLACLRAGVRTQGGTLYTTTFPCHNCARHIVAAGISRVVYVEPYPKSRASQLHSDSIRIEGQPEDEIESRKPKVEFEPFVGIGPRRYFDLFSMVLSTGRPIKRRTEDGNLRKWDRNQAQLRVPMLPTSYLEREELAVSEIQDTLEALQGR